MNITRNPKETNETNDTKISYSDKFHEIIEIQISWTYFYEARHGIK